MATTKHTISVFVENVPGVLQRISGLFARRGYNIESLAVGPTERPEYSRMTIVIKLDDKPVEQVIRQVQKLVPVVGVRELKDKESVDRELMLLKVRTSPAQRPEVRELVELFRARIVDVAPHALMVEATGTPDKLDALEENLRPYGIEELCRTGRVALERGDRALPPELPTLIGNRNAPTSSSEKEER